jgi:predicted nucleotidyltransferase
MNEASEGHRQRLLDGLRRFVTSVRKVPGVKSIAVLGSIVTTKPDPKDIDVLVVVADDADVATGNCVAAFAGPHPELQSGRRRVSCR